MHNWAPKNCTYCTKAKNFCLRCKKTGLLDGYLSRGVFLWTTNYTVWPQENCSYCTKKNDVHRRCKKLTVLVGSIYERVQIADCTIKPSEICVLCIKTKNLSQQPFILTFFVAYQVRELWRDTYQVRRNSQVPLQKLCKFPKMKLFIKKVEFWPFSMPTNWGTKKFSKLTLTKCRFHRDKWKAFLNPSQMYLDNFIFIHLIHSPPPEPGGHAPWPFLMRAIPLASTTG